MKIYCGQAGQYGDSLMNLCLARFFRDTIPDSEIHFGISKKYSSILPILKLNTYIDNFIIWEGYDHGLTERDERLIDEYQFDIFCDPFKGNSSRDWYRTMHQVEDVFRRHGLTCPEEYKKIKFEITNEDFKRLFSYCHPKQNLACFAPFANKGQGVKSLSVQKAQGIVDELVRRDIRVDLLVGPGDPILHHCRRVTDWEESLKSLLSCRKLITTDTSINWLASGFSIPTIGLLATSYYNYSDSKNWQPINADALYFQSEVANDIDNSHIFLNL